VQPLERAFPQNRCVRCLVASARDRLARRSRLSPQGRLARLVRNTALALTVSGIIAVPLNEVPREPKADAHGLVAVPKLRVPVREPGYQLATDKGDVVPFGASVSGTAPTGIPFPVIGIARTATGAGAWTATADGGVFTNGDALFYGSLGGQHLNRPIVGIAATPTGQGYWLVSEDGGVFAFGDAGFYGSLSGQRLNNGIVGIAPTKDGGGYWLAGADGGVFAFGNAGFYGSVDTTLVAHVTSIAATPAGDGYWLAGADGGVFAFGDADFFGRPNPNDIHGWVIGIAASRSGDGYWLAATDGGVFTYGDAPFLGAHSGRTWGRVVGIAAGAGRPVTSDLQILPRRMRSAYGHDISWPQCDGPLPGAGYGHGIVGVTGGRPFRHNRCLAEQWRWATSGGAGGGVYINLAAAVIGGPAEMHGPAGDCGIRDLPCQTYNQSANNVGDAIAYARSAGVDAPMWWLDVEILNRWSPNQALNALTVKAAAETLRKAGLNVGVYSTPLMWRTITGGAQMDLPVWVAGAPTDADAPTWCDRPEKNFTGAGVWLVQSLPIVYDVNYACRPVLDAPTSVFRFAE
jgi:hypothetical protein